MALIHEQSTSKLSSLILLAALAVFSPSQTEAKQMYFSDLRFEAPATSVQQVKKFPIRNDFSLLQQSRQYITAKQEIFEGPAYDNVTLAAIQTAASKINRPTQSAKLTVEGDKATEFVPSQQGQALDVYKTLAALGNGSLLELPVLTAQPQVSLSETNSLGIKELVAVGESDFSGSSRNRITNITVGASRFNGVIIKPGEEFSFNKYLGDVDKAHGFVQEIVIKREGLVPEYGGGLCQVSTTAFRGAMNAGFPINQRKNHAFAVKYYSPAGSDATIYAPQLDMKFTNDLQSHMLVRTRIEGTKLYFEYYGTKDDRQVVLDGPYQYDKRSDGSMKTIWTKRVTKNGQTAEQVFRSNYVSPSLYQKVAKVEEPASTPAPQPPAEQPTVPAQ